MTITDDMVAAANAALYRVLFGRHDGTVLELRAAAMRAALEAALAAAPQSEPSECPHGLFDLCCNSFSDCALDRPRRPEPDALREALK